VGANVEDTFLRDLNSADFTIGVGLGDVGNLSDTFDDGFGPSVLRAVFIAHQVEAVGDDVVVGNWET